MTFLATFAFQKRHIFNIEQATHLGFFNEWLSVSLYASDIPLIILLITSIPLLARRYKQLITPTTFIALALVLISIVSITSINEVLIERGVFSSLKLFLAVFTCIYIVTQKRTGHIVMLATTLLASVFQTCVAFIQFATQKDLGLSILGEISLSPQLTNIAEIVDNGTQMIRPVGTFQHANVLAAFLLLGFISGILLIHLINTRKGTCLKMPFHKKLIIIPEASLRTTKLYISIALSIVSAGIILTFSRSIIFAFIATLLTILVFALRNSDVVMKRILLMPILVVCITSLILSPHLVPRGTQLDAHQDGAVSSRISRSNEALSFISEQKMLGHGIGSYVYTSIQHFPEKETWMHQPVHNVLIVAAEIGILGCILFILLILILCIKKSRAPTDVHVSIVASLIMIMFTDHYFWTLHQGIFTFWILLALLAILKKYTYVPQRT